MKWSVNRFPLGHVARRGCVLLSALLVTPAAWPQGLADTIEAIHHARVVTRILYVTAHPDDESASVLTYLARGLGADVALLSVTRGEGGQNAIGPEQGPELAMVRTEELSAATRAYGVHLYFTRAPDFGYSKSAEETLKIWDDIALEDIVRVLRTFRPEIVINQWGGVHGGHGHHQATGLLVPQAVEAAADANKFPQQIAEGLKPWRVATVFQRSRGEAQGWRVPSDTVSPLRGMSYLEIGLKGFANHRSQGITAFVDVPFFRQPIYLYPPGGIQFDPAILAEPLGSLPARFPALANVLRPSLERADQILEGAMRTSLAPDWPASAALLADAGKEIAELRSKIAGPGSDQAASALWELDRIREKINQAFVLATALRFQLRADRSDLVAGESFTVEAIWNWRHDVPLEIGKPTLILPAGWQVTNDEPETEPGRTGVRFTVEIPHDAHAHSSPDDAIEPWPAPLVRARLTARVSGRDYPAEVVATAEAHRDTSTRTEVLEPRLVPAVSLTVEPQQLVLRQNQPSKSIGLLARIRYSGTSVAEIVAGLDVPQGWSVEPVAPLHFTEPGDQLARFVVTPPAHPAAGAYVLKPFARRGGETFRASVEPLPTLPTRIWEHPAEATVHVLDLVLPEKLRVGYITADNDLIPEALRQLGVQVQLLDEAELAFGDLHGFDAIVVGIRAYELREDLPRANQRLLDYVAAGGTLVVQYQRDFAWNRLHPAPYPASMEPAQRITDENSPVRFVARHHPALNFPNKITQADFNGWLQERGLYFWSKFDSHYQPLLAMSDPGESEVLGALVYARVGKGVYIYTGLAFFRQLPAGVPGAYRLFVNLLSQSRAASNH